MTCNGVLYNEGTLAYISGNVHFGAMLNECLQSWNVIVLCSHIQRAATLLGRRDQYRSHTDHE